MAKNIKMEVSRDDDNNSTVITRQEIGRYMNIFGNKQLLNLPGGKFAYFMEKNLRIVTDETKRQEVFNAKAVNKRGKISDEYLAAEKEILEQYCSKDEQGNPIVRDGMYNIPNDIMDEFKKSREAALELVPEFASDSAKVEKYNQTMDKYMAEEISLNFHKIKEEDLPSSITGALRLMISEFIVE